MKLINLGLTRMLQIIIRNGLQSQPPEFQLQHLLDESWACVMCCDDRDHDVMCKCDRIMLSRSVQKFNSYQVEIGVGVNRRQY